MGGPSTAMTTTPTTTKRHQIERRYICLLFYNRLVIMCVCGVEATTCVQPRAALDQEFVLLVVNIYARLFIRNAFTHRTR